MITKKLAILTKNLTKLTTPIRYHTTNQPQPLQSTPKITNKLPIQSLSQLMKQRISAPSYSLDVAQHSPANLFISLSKSIKQNLYRIPQQEQKIIYHINKHKQNPEYIKNFIYLLLPIDNLFPKLNQVYKDIALKFLTEIKQAHKQEIYLILDNLQRTILSNSTMWMDQQWITRDYTKEQAIARLLTPKVIAMGGTFDISIFIKLANLCITLGVDDYELSAFLLKNLGQPSCRVKMRQILIVLRYLSQVRIFPYQYFYKNKSKWIAAIESYNKYSTKLTYQSIKMLQVIVAQNPMYCQRLIKKLQDLLLEAMPSLDQEDLPNLWHICNRAKFGVYRELMEKMLEKMSGLVDRMSVRDLCLLVRGFDNFKELQDFGEVSRDILVRISKKLPEERQYEREIVKEVLKKLDKMQNLQAN